MVVHAPACRRAYDSEYREATGGRRLEWQGGMPCLTALRDGAACSGVGVRAQILGGSAPTVLFDDRPAEGRKGKEKRGGRAAEKGSTAEHQHKQQAAAAAAGGEGAQKRSRTFRGAIKLSGGPGPGDTPPLPAASSSGPSPPSKQPAKQPGAAEADEAEQRRRRREQERQLREEEARRRAAELRASGVSAPAELFPLAELRQKREEEELSAYVAVARPKAKREAPQPLAVPAADAPEAAAAPRAGESAEGAGGAPSTEGADGAVAASTACPEAAATKGPATASKKRARGCANDVKCASEGSIC